MTAADRRGLSPLFWSNANLYGTIDIEMDRHLDLGLRSLTSGFGSQSPMAVSRRPRCAGRRHRRRP